MPQVDPQVAQLLRVQTDELLFDVVTRDFTKVAKYFAPGAEVDVADQLQRYFKAPLRRLTITGWDAKAIVVEHSADKRQARTGVRVEVQEGGGQPVYRVVVFLWEAADEKCEVFHLVPLD